MACGAQSFNNVDRNVWNCLVAKAAQYGVNISANSGSASSHGFDVSWNYDPAKSFLSIQVTDKPFFAPCGLVNGKIHDEVDSCMQAHGAELGTIHH
jgi:hypothetical protein